VAVLGTAAVTAMVVAYALERRSATFVLAFAGGCALSSVYGFLIGSVPSARSRRRGLCWRCAGMRCECKTRGSRFSCRGS
jgi:hypothetical protein